jgi:outer membrane immunogenic protein
VVTLAAIRFAIHQPLSKDHSMTISISQLVRRQFAGAVAIVALLIAPALWTSSAVAADLPVKAGLPVVEAPLWTAFYIGVHGGAGQGRSSLEDPRYDITYVPIHVESRGSLAGAQVGADWQLGSVVVGGEIDASWSSIKGRLTDSSLFTNFVTSGLSAEYKTLATATGRVGYAYGNLLGYAKGGVAWANIDYRSGINTPFPVINDHQRTGLTAGAGVEFLVIKNLSVRAEYDFVYFGAQAIQLSSRVPVNLDHELHLVKLGLNWRFTGDYLTARY